MSFLFLSLTVNSQWTQTEHQFQIFLITFKTVKTVDRSSGPSQGPHALILNVQKDQVQVQTAFLFSRTLLLKLL